MSSQLVRKVDKNFSNPSELADREGWGEVLTCCLQPGWGGEEGAHTVHSEAALVGPGLAPLSRHQEGPVTQQPAGAAQVQRDSVLAPAHLWLGRSRPGAVQAGGAARLENSPLWSGHDLELGKLPVTWKFRIY